MPRRAADERSERRVARLIDLLLGDVEGGGETIASIARAAGLDHETVRRLSRNPGGRMRSGPGFFVVAAIARARGVSLDWLAAETIGPADRQQRQ
jgi:hypothetical protein